MVKNQRGNVLFLILIAVALFAALSYAVTSNSRGGGSDITKDKAKLYAAEIIQYATQMEQTVSSLRVINQCLDTQISFDSSVIAGYVNPNAPTNKKCHVFDTAAGGGISIKRPGAHLNDKKDFYYTGRVCVVDVGSGGLYCYNDDTASDLVMYLPNIHKEICIEINNKLDIINPAGVPPKADNNEYKPFHNHEFIGAYNNGGSAQTGGAGEAANYNQKYSGCFEGFGNVYLPADTYHYYHVLIAR